MKKLLFLAAVFSILIVSGCISQRQQESIKIGAILMLSGVGSNWGSNSLKGAELAIEEINNSGGINGKKIEIVAEDNEGDNSKAAVTALQKLINQKIGIVLGTNWTPSGLAVAPIACREKILMISPSLGVAGFNETCDYLFNLWPHDDALSEQLGEYLYQKGYRNIAVLGSLQEWEQTQALAVKKGFESAGGKVVSFQLPQKEEKDFRTEALKIKESNPDAVVFANYAYEDLSAKRLKEIGVEKPFFSILMDDDRIKGAEGAFEGTTVITSFTPSQQFVERFVQKEGMQPDIGSDTSYDAVMLIAKAIKETNSVDSTVLKDYINSLGYYDGASGHLKFDGKGGVTKTAALKIVKDNKLVPLED